MRSVVPDDDQVYGVEEQLENISEHQRQGKKHDFPEQRTVAHVDLIFISGHYSIPFLK